MKSTSIADWLSKLGDKVPVPGGGAVAGLNAAIAAATLKMVCEYSQGPKYEEAEAIMKQAAEKLAGLSRQGLDEAENDEVAYAKLRQAFAIDKDSPKRPAAIQTAVQAAVEPAVSTINVVKQILQITEEIIEKSNKNLISDVAVSTASAKAALESALVNIEINLPLVKEDALATNLRAKTTEAEELLNNAGQLFSRARNLQKENS